MSIKIGMISLGCPKNQVDAEMMLNALDKAGYEIVPAETDAEVIIVNTCGFIEAAKTEAVENILEAAAYKKEGTLRALIVTGCLAERYREDILEEMPEVDAVVSIGKNGDIAKIVEETLNRNKGLCYNAEKTDLCIDDERMLSTPFYMAYLKIAEGCDNCCTYCAIPSIRGRFRSRKIENIIKEAKALAQKGVKELVVIAQDTTRYGEDLYGEPSLAKLLGALSEIEGIEWIRTLYTYPDRITDELIDVVACNDKIVNYFDIPIQHCNANILKRMNRRGDKKSLVGLIEKIREKIPNVTLRTSLITGFPGETEENFSELCEFVGQVRFDRLGCFAFSAEEDTPAAEYPNQIDEQIKVDRAENIMNQQLTIAQEKNDLKIGTLQKVLIEGYDDYIKCYFGRTEADAPEIDGKIFFTTSKPLVIGSFVMVQVNDTMEYDLLGEVLEENNESAE